MSLHPKLVEYQDAKIMLRDAERGLDNLAWDSRDMTVAEAYKLGLIKFNFPVSSACRMALQADPKTLKA